MMKRDSRCMNLNHGRANAPVRHCPMCGDVVNQTITLEECAEEKHTIRRRRGSTYCVDCGKRLVMKT